MAKSKTNKKQGNFLENYDLEESYLKKANSRKGEPGLLEGYTATGEPVLIRHWPRTSSNADDGLTDIWRNEIRALHRLAGSPGAAEYIARLIDAGEDKKGFYVVLSVDQRRPLAKLLENQTRKSGIWLRAAASPTNRKKIWQNLRRIACGLDVLHTHGLIHCNLDFWSILSTGDNTPDFQLTGFEWSLRLSGSDRKRNSRRTILEKPISFVDDWADFARLTADLMKISVDRLSDKRIPPHEVSDHLLADEASFLRELLQPRDVSQINGEYVQRRIDAIIDGLTESAAATDYQFQIAVSLGTDSGLSRSIRAITNQSIDLDDVATQIDFVKADLSPQPRAISIQAQNGSELVIRGEQLVYELRQFRMPSSDELSWDIAFCSSASPAEEWQRPINSAFPMAGESIRLQTIKEAFDRAPRIRGHVRSWSEVNQLLEPQQPLRPSREEEVFNALELLHLMEIALTAVNYFPVSIQTEPKPTQQSEDRMLRLRLNSDPARERLSSALGLSSLTEQLLSLLESDAISDDEGWLITEGGKLGRRTATDIEIQYERVERRSGEVEFVFRLSQHVAPPPTQGYLVPGGIQGVVSQLIRRNKALKGLKDHVELLNMISDPRGRIINSHERISDDNPTLQKLDEAKKQAFREILEILPLYLVQGPPGVGKTFLIRELVNHQFSEEPATRLLLSAQSNHAVDHLMSEIESDWSNDPDLLVVRCGGGDERIAKSQLDLRSQSQSIVKRLKSSELINDISEPLRKKLASISYDKTGRQDKANIERRTLDALTLRAANVVLATTNSGDLERLFEMRAQFDWAIIEEAAKASGSELLFPLLLSHRRLMIGDHKQLQPFGAETLTRLLLKPAALQTTLSTISSFVERSLIDIAFDDLRGLLTDEKRGDEFSALCSTAIRSLTLFETMIEEELSDLESRNKPKRKRIATTLNIQHRMHPAISNLVSRCFYDGKLTTAPTAIQKFDENPCPIQSRNPKRLPDLPIVVVDMPYQQSTVGLKNVEQFPRFTNLAEAEAVKEVAKLLAVPKGVTKKPTLVFLSPYLRQVQLLEAALRDDTEIRKNFSHFTPVARGDAWCSTVDAFQGNEADIVVLSLVRNNHHATPQRALGFLSNPKRMNVLLSRAKWRLVLITSLDFLDTVTAPLGSNGDQDPAFIRLLLSALKDGAADGTTKIISPSTLLDSSL